MRAFTANNGLSRGIGRTAEFGSIFHRTYSFWCMGQFVIFIVLCILLTLGYTMRRHANEPFRCLSAAFLYVDSGTECRLSISRADIMLA